MTFKVVWQQLALKQLALAWLNSSNQPGVNEAATQVDRLLATDPDQKGQDYFGDRFVVFSAMWALYRVKAELRIVEVLQVGIPDRDLPHDELE